MPMVAVFAAQMHAGLVVPIPAAGAVPEGSAVQLYVWQPARVELDAARRRFTMVLDRVANRYAESYGEPFPVRVISAADCLVGRVGPATGVLDAERVPHPGATGVVLSGVPEPEPATEGNPSDPGEALRLALGREILPRDHGGADRWTDLAPRWRGRWAAVAWEQGRVVVANGVSPGLRLWWTEGPDGWALGSLPGPLLAFAARPRSIDLDVATLTAASGYVSSSRALFVGVHRFMPGDRVSLQAGASPALMRFSGFDAVLGDRRQLTYDEAVDEFAHRAAGLVGAAAARSTNPRLSLSGGHDSRLLAAALVRAGHPIVASTGGPATSADVVIARRVASSLGLEHKVDADAKPGDTDEARRERARSGSRARSLPMTAERLAAWVALHDGTAPVELAWARRDLSVRREVGARPREQLISGLGGETHRGRYYPRARDVDRPGSARRAKSRVLDRFAPGPLNRPVRELLSEELSNQADALGDDSLPLSEWMARFHWRFREAFRGADVMAQNDSAFWGFAPLMDLGFLALSREVAAAAKMSDRLFEDVTLRLAPELAAIPYDRRPASSPPELVVTLLGRFGLLDVARDARRRLSGGRRPSTSPDVLRKLWEEVYFGPGDHLWPELIGERQLRSLVRHQPAGAIPRDLAVPELLFRSEAAG